MFVRSRHFQTKRIEPHSAFRSYRRLIAQCELIVASGSMSVGDEDYMTRTVRRRGSLDIWQIKIKPGKPIGLVDIDDCPTTR